MAQDKKPQILLADKVEITPIEVNNLRRTINAIVSANPMVPPNVARFIGSNQQELLKRYEKNAFAEKELRDQYQQYLMYIEQDEHGRHIWWDKTEDNIVMKSNPLAVAGATTDDIVDEEKSTFGVRAWFDSQSRKLFVINTGQEITDQTLRLKMQPYVLDPEKRVVYEEKMTAFDKKMDELYNLKSSVRVKRISWDYLEQIRLAIPPTSYNQALQRNEQLDLYAFGKYLTIQDEEEAEAEETHAPKMAVVKE